MAQQLINVGALVAALDAEKKGERTVLASIGESRGNQPFNANAHATGEIARCQYILSIDTMAGCAG